MTSDAHEETYQSPLAKMADAYSQHNQELAESYRQKGYSFEADLFQKAAGDFKELAGKIEEQYDPELDTKEVVQAMLAVDAVARQRTLRANSRPETTPPTPAIRLRGDWQERTKNRCPGYLAHPSPKSGTPGREC